MLGDDLKAIYRFYRELKGEDPIDMQEIRPGVWTMPEGRKKQAREIQGTIDRIEGAFNKARTVIEKVNARENAIPEAKGDGEICPKL